MNFIGTWHIYEMEMWDEDYFNMEVQAYIKIVSNTKGNFQFFSTKRKEIKSAFALFFFTLP